MKNVVVASTNPVKLAAVRYGFERVFSNEKFGFETVSVASGVSDQPLSSSETLSGATTRAKNARMERSMADFWVGLEGGIERTQQGMLALAWIVVVGVSSETHGIIGKGRTGSFFLPPEVARLIEAGHELGTADDIVFGRTNSKQENGAVGILTNNIFTRARFYSDAVVLALIPFLHTELYTSSKFEETELR
ncbi:MAG TPA: inosine/xanthosine triphosphatase [Patescibacteria group bacterium]|nr:inosine/xanthosine triphosphatase [Patescibacteria group bacterium]